MDASYSDVKITEEVTAAQTGQVRQANINGVYYYPLTLLNYSIVNITIISTVPINMNMTGTYDNATFNNDLYGSNWGIHLNRGPYIINYSSSTPTKAFIIINATPTLVDPVPKGDYSASSFPIGIASYGLNNYTGTPIPYVIKTNLIEGGANITAIYAYNAMPPANVSRYGASLQLNAVMDVLSGGRTYTYWLQDVLSLDTYNQSYYIENNVWNFSTDNATLSNATVHGIGGVYQTMSTWPIQARSSITMRTDSPSLITPSPYISIQTSWPVWLTATLWSPLATTPLTEFIITIT